jgi:hypothetical protein
MLSYFGNALFGMNLNESFAQVNIAQSPGYGYMAVGTNGIALQANFTDSYCAAFNPFPPITTLPPQTPLLTDVVDSSIQTYSLGSTIIGGGVPVQTQMLTRYRDHITVTPLTSHR